MDGKVDSARALLPGMGIALSAVVSVCAVRSYVIPQTTDDWMDGRSRHTDDTDVLLRIHLVIGERPRMVRRFMGAASRQGD